MHAMVRGCAINRDLSSVPDALSAEAVEARLACVLQMTGGNITVDSRQLAAAYLQPLS